MEHEMFAYGLGLCIGGVLTGASLVFAWYSTLGVALALALGGGALIGLSVLLE